MGPLTLQFYLAPLQTVCPSTPHHPQGKRARPLNFDPDEGSDYQVEDDSDDGEDELDERFSEQDEEQHIHATKRKKLGFKANDNDITATGTGRVAGKVYGRGAGRGAGRGGSGGGRGRGRGRGTKKATEEDNGGGGEEDLKQPQRGRGAGWSEEEGKALAKCLVAFDNWRKDLPKHRQPTTPQQQTKMHMLACKFSLRGYCLLPFRGVTGTLLQLHPHPPSYIRSPRQPVIRRNLVEEEEYADSVQGRF